MYAIQDINVSDPSAPSAPVSLVPGTADMNKLDVYTSDINKGTKLLQNAIEDISDIDDETMSNVTWILVVGTRYVLYNVYTIVHGLYTDCIYSCIQSVYNPYTIVYVLYSQLYNVYTFHIQMYMDCTSHVYHPVNILAALTLQSHPKVEKATEYIEAGNKLVSEITWAK